MKLDLSFDYFFYLIIQIPTEIQHGSSGVAQSYVLYTLKNSEHGAFLEGMFHIHDKVRMTSRRQSEK
jgi:hypothetical protein